MPNVTTAIRSPRGLRADERAGRGGRVAERLPVHRLRAVDGEDDALRPAEVHRVEADDRPAVLGHVGRRRAGFGVTTVTRTVG